MGQGSSSTVIWLVDGASGFGDPSHPKAVFKTPAGNKAFRHFFRDMAIDTGRRNPGAVGIDYISSNVGSVRNVVIRSGDGRGHTGLAMTRDWSGPQLVTDVEVDGFDTGIAEHNGNLSPVMEHVTLRGQRRAGIRTDYYLVVRSLLSVNRVPAVVAPSGMLTLVDARLTGGAGGPAVDSDGRHLFVRGLVTQGYASALRHRGRTIAGPAIGEYAGDTSALFTARATSLSLPVRDTPVGPAPSADDWVEYQYRNTAHQLSRLSAAMNSGKSQVLLPSGHHLQYDRQTIEVPGGVRLIRGFGTTINGSGKGRGGGGLTLVVGDGTTPLIIQGLEKGVTIEHRGRRPVALVDGFFRYQASAGAGDLFLEDAAIGPITVARGQHVWARSYNNESPPEQLKIVNAGGTLWVLGLKTERNGIVLDARPGSSTELLGALIYTTRPFTDEERGKPAFSVTDARLSMTVLLQSFGAERSYTTAVRETRDGTTRSRLVAQTPAYSLYRAGP